MAMATTRVIGTDRIIRKKFLFSKNFNAFTRSLCSTTTGDGDTQSSGDGVVSKVSSNISSASKDDHTVGAKDYLMGSLPSTMKAAVFWEPGRPMSIEELQMPRPKIGEVLIKTRGMPVSSI